MPRFPGVTERKMYRLKEALIRESEGMLGEDGADETLSSFWGYSLQAHHCISCSVMKKMKELDRKARQAGYDINDVGNGIALPARFGHQRINNEQRHRGGHSDTYYSKVQKKLEPIYKRYKDKDVCGEANPTRKRFLNALHKVEDEIKTNLEKRKWWLYDWSKELYKADYKDEGGGNLKSGRRPDTSVSDAEQWLENYGRNSRAVKRRYIIKKVGKEEKKVLRTEWYEKYDYPIPRGLTS